MSRHALCLFTLYKILYLQVVQMRVWIGWWWFCFWIVFIRYVHGGCYCNVLANSSFELADARAVITLYFSDRNNDSSLIFCGFSLICVW